MRYLIYGGNPGRVTSLQPAPRLQLERARRHASAKGVRWTTAVLLSPRRRVALGARNHARRCACSRMRVPVGGGGRMISSVLARGVVFYFVLNFFLKKKVLGPQCGGGGHAKNGPAKLALFFRLRERAARATGRGRGQGPGGAPPEPKGVGRGERRRRENAPPVETNTILSCFLACY